MHAVPISLFVMAVTDPAKGSRGGITAFLVDKGTKGVSIPTVLNTIGEHAPYGVFFDNVELSDDQVLGEVGKGFGPMQNRLGVRRMEIGARSLGYARRCLDLMIPQANERVTFGKPLADRQAVQWWIADSFQEMEMVRLITWRLACKIDAGEDQLAPRRRHGQGAGHGNDHPRGRPRHANVRRHGHDQGHAAGVHVPRLPRMAHLRRPQRSAPLVYRAGSCCATACRTN